MPTQWIVALRKLQVLYPDHTWQEHLGERVEVDGDEEYLDGYQFVESVSRTGWAPIGHYNAIIQVEEGTMYLAQVRNEDNEVPRGYHTIEELYAWYCSYFTEGRDPLYSLEELRAYLAENVLNEDGPVPYEMIDGQDMDTAYLDSHAERGIPVPEGDW